MNNYSPTYSSSMADFIDLVLIKAYIGILVVTSVLYIIQLITTCTVIYIVSLLLIQYQTLYNVHTPEVCINLHGYCGTGSLLF